jgi:hypothetical protein
LAVVAIKKEIIMGEVTTKDTRARIDIVTTARSLCITKATTRVNRITASNTITTKIVCITTDHTKKDRKIRSSTQTKVARTMEGISTSPPTSRRAVPDTWTTKGSVRDQIPPIKTKLLIKAINSQRNNRSKLNKRIHEMSRRGLKNSMFRKQTLIRSGSTTSMTRWWWRTPTGTREAATTRDKGASTNIGRRVSMIISTIKSSTDREIKGNIIKKNTFRVEARGVRLTNTTPSSTTDWAVMSIITIRRSSSETQGTGTRKSKIKSSTIRIRNSSNQETILIPDDRILEHPRSWREGRSL